MRPWLALLVAVLLSGCTSFWTGSIEPVPAPDIQTQAVDGSPVNLTALEGPVLLDFMGTWCLPCQRAVPVLRDLQAAYPELHVISISSTDSAAKISDFQTRHGASWPHIADDGTIVNAYREAGTSAGAMMWPSYGLVVDGELVFYNRGETLPATFTAVLDRHVERQAPAITPDAVPWIGFALLAGAASWFSPWLLPILRDEPRRPRQHGVLLAAWMLALGALAAFWSRPLSGRVATVAPFLAAAGVVMVAVWRWRGIRAPTSKGLAAEGWRHAVALHGQWLWLTLPVWAAFLHAAMLRTAPVESLLIVAAVGIGAALADLRPAWAKHPQVGWLGAGALIAGAAVNGWLYLR